jgi:hypothetical protein
VDNEGWIGELFFVLAVGVTSHLNTFSKELQDKYNLAITMSGRIMNLRVEFFLVEKLIKFS